MRKLDNITPIEEDFGRWFEDVVTKGNLIDYGPVKGTIIFKPVSYGIWENIQTELNKVFRKKKILNVYLPLLLPLAHINKEKEHIEGFAPELATITKVGEKELSEHIIIRPTSEMLFGQMFAKEINSYNDLPLVYNQWANVVRWEKNTKPFLRNSEFLWQEGHTAHSTEDEAKQMTKKMIFEYQKFLREFLAVPVIVGAKTEFEKFAGAEETYTIEAMMKDGKALQAGTSHYLGQNFSKAMNIKFKNVTNKDEFVFQTSWGVSTRLIGAIIMTHGDDRGVIIPPKIAPYQIDILELFANKSDVVGQKSKEIEDSLIGAGFRVRVDKTKKGPGYKAANSEIQGTPLRIEIGPRDLENSEVTVVRRDTLEKKNIKISEVIKYVSETLKLIQKDLLQNAEDRLKKNIVTANTYEEMKILLEQRKFVLVPFNGDKEHEETIKKETLATTRCIPFDMQSKDLKECIMTGKKTSRYVIFARAY